MNGFVMEMDSGSMPSSGGCGSSDSLNGLKFGKKIYFEDVGGGGGSSSSSTSRVPSLAPVVKKGKVVVQGGQQPPRCQVEGCMVDLTGAKAYYCRHKVCGMHSKAPMVVVAGMEQRFCQQCSRFHQLSEFDQGKRSCRRRLAGHNERRRKPPPAPLSHYGRLPSSFQYDGSRFRSFHMDFTYPRLPAAAIDVWPTVRADDQVASDQWHRSTYAPHAAAAGYEALPYMQGPTSVSRHQQGQCLTGVTDSRCALSLLSTQPWCATASRNRVPAISASSCFDGAPVFQPVMTSYEDNYMGFKGHGVSSSSHENHHEMGHGYGTYSDDCQFSGELELALQGSRQCPVHCPSRVYNHTCHGMQWPL